MTAQGSFEAESFISGEMQGRIIQGAKGGYSPGAPQDRGHHIGWL